MKTILSSLFLFIFALVAVVKGAIVVQDLTSTEFNALSTLYTPAWSVVYRGGGISGINSEEIRLARNTNTPQPGGGVNTSIGDLTWSPSNNDLQISIDGAGNISARANSTTVGTFPIVRSFNQILIFLYDESALDSTSLTGININTFATRNMFADGFVPAQTDVISITNFGSQAPFDLNAVWSPGNNPGDDQQYVQIVAIQNTTIPEPSSCVLLGITSLLLFRRKR